MTGWVAPPQLDAQLNEELFISRNPHCDLYKYPDNHPCQNVAKYRVRMRCANPDHGLVVRLLCERCKVRYWPERDEWITCVVHRLIKLHIEEVTPL